MSFEVGDLVKHNASATLYVVLDVAEEGMTIKQHPRGNGKIQLIHESHWRYWIVVAGRPGPGRLRNTYRNLDLG